MVFLPAIVRNPWDDFCRVSKQLEESFCPRRRMRNVMQLQRSKSRMESPYSRPWHSYNNKLSGISRIETDKDSFKVVMDVDHFLPNEITVKTVENQVVIEGKHDEKEDGRGYVSRHFVRRYQLPEDVEAETVISTLSSDGVLTVSAPRNLPLERDNVRIIPITLTEAPAIKNISETPKAEKEKETVICDSKA